jgi:hypothetical protein
MGRPSASTAVPLTRTVRTGTSVSDTGVRLVARKAVIATGKVVMSAARATQSLRPSALRVIAIPDDEMTRSLSNGDAQPRVNDDWSFQVTLPPGRTRLFLFGAAPGWDTRAVRSRGIDVTDVGIDVKPGEDLTG